MQKTQMNRAIALIAALTVMSIGAAGASAATLQWVFSDFDDASLILNSGSLHNGGAYNFGSATTVTVNGVSFVGENDGAQDDTAYRFAGDGTYLNASAADVYSGATVTGLTGAETNDLLDSFAYDNNNTVPSEVKGLTSGNIYAVQVLVVDDRGGTIANRNLHFSESGSTWEGDYVDYTSVGSAQLGTAIFRADGATQGFRIGIDGVGETHHNALQVRDITGVLPAISFSSANLTDTSQLDTSGTIVLARNEGSVSSFTVDGVTFVGTGGGPLGQTPIANDRSAFNRNSGSGATNLTGTDDTELEGVLASHTFTGSGETFLQLSELEVGREYRIQLLFSDTRSGGSIPGRDINIADLDGAGFDIADLGYTPTDNGPQLVTGTFVATSAFQAISILNQTSGDANVGGHLNGYVLTLIEVPAPAALPAGLMLLAAAATRRRR